MLSLILDVQSSIVRASLVLNPKGHVPMVIYTYSVDLAYKNHVTPSYLIKVTLRAITECIEATLQYIYHHSKTGKIPKHISDIHYVLSSPWILSKARNMSYTFPKATVVNKAHVLAKISENSDQLAPEDASRVHVVEQKICDVRLNGYTVADWDGKATTQFDASYVTSIADIHMTKRFQDACGHAVSHRHVHFHSALLLQYVSMQYVKPDLEHYLLLHVHGEVTDVVIVNRLSCTFFGSYQMGIRNIVRKLALETKSNVQTAESLITLFVSEHMNPAHDQGSELIISNLREGWTNELHKLLTRADLASKMPVIAILSAGSHEDFFAQSLSRAYPHIKIEPLLLDDLKGHVSFDPSAEHLRMTGLYGIALQKLE